MPENWTDWELQREVEGWDDDSVCPNCGHDCVAKGDPCLVLDEADLGFPVAPPRQERNP